jgi:dihydroneopterin aldolase
VIDVTCSLTPRPAEDDLATTVDYSELAQSISRVARTGSVDLIETLAERVSETVLANQRIAEVEVTVHKPQAPLAVPFSDVSVTITRRNPS